MARSSEYANESQQLFLHAILSEFSDRDLSPFMVDRLVKLCPRAEYRANEAWKTGLTSVQTDCQDDMDRRKLKLLEEEDNTLMAVKELQAKIRQTQKEIERLMLRRRIEDIQSRIQELKGDEMQKEEEMIQKRASMVRDETECSYFVPLVIDEPNKSLLQENIEKQAEEWIEIDDEEDYFQSKSGGGSEWVLCL
jgi:hypothetical protein